MLKVALQQVTPGRTPILTQKGGFFRCRGGVATGCREHYNAVVSCRPQHAGTATANRGRPVRYGSGRQFLSFNSNQEEVYDGYFRQKATLWRTEVENKPGALSSVLGPLAKAGVDLQVVMGYRYPDKENKAAIQVCTVSGKKATTAAGKAGLAASDIPTLLVQGDNRPGVGYAIAQAIAEAGINVMFVVAQVIDGVLGRHGF